MNQSETRSSRRAFFLKGGAALGTGIATGAGASGVLSRASPSENEDVQARLAAAQEREAIRRLHRKFTRLIEAHEFEAVVALFHEHAELALSGEIARGRPGIEVLLTSGYRNQAVATLHEAYRANAQQEDRIEVGDNLREARATWHVDVALAVPLRDDSTAAQMARLQGQLADRRWVSGRLEARYVKSGTEWQMASLRYVG